jgi:hypothetical protein
VLPIVRRLLGVVFITGLVGTGIELLLLEHTEDWQLVPLVLIALGLAAAGWLLATRSAVAARAVQGLMMLFVVSGAVGLGLHYQGNVEFELEMYPSLEGWELFRKAMSGATPALAPGTMIQLGLIGLAYVYSQSAARGARDAGREAGTCDD